MESLKGRDFLSLADVSVDELYSLLGLASQLKSGMVKVQRNKVLGLMFSKASTRTRVSFTVAMYQLGGQVIDLNPSVTQVSRGEPLVDTARVLDRYLDIIAIRTFEQKDLETFADYAKIPVINALTDREHPCQVLADLMTVQECFGKLSGLTLTYFGDGANNMAHSLLLGCAMVGMNVRIAAPADHQPNRDIVDQAIEIASSKTEVTVTDDPIEAAKNAHVIYTDVWASMGQEEEARTRIPLFQPYQVNEQLMAKAANNAIVLHCLPAHREEEITNGVIEGKQSRVWDQAENRMHAQKALLAVLLG
ncbi:MAG: ornithine carbamoyltransferase [Limnoraphis robusta]|jgi:ornithine carbamoyltransferase|uniref:Ornithine carbamoyltransferase n=2 Tax=Limnoraphis robusta TaxID=1118279 RepID=A0A0F5YCZ5_9CYAN|nr:ornithine carbamoyltransferase [Limnoraphis robusta]KKD36751.1 ornithine carbamoyltransferase [Limnoraphis robusta CS-951]MEA5499630.1 ornithine carbamoyltransferase [Limnoraphis robusta BA-68 BA1]MEA5517780.1 ornithine carbamoyltransferase [Limnoraphis robusta CCNP1315]MEA5541063.1 ornithine carbamoyltransferase [Limnoraphis robusta Tam1]MEA5546414.1 ornithine carbamoyltransferase [Limnoraphis robusta CCNP1324]